MVTFDQRARESEYDDGEECLGSADGECDGGVGGGHCVGSAMVSGCVVGRVGVR